MKNKILAILVALLVAFGVGFVPQYLSVRELTQELAELRASSDAQLTASESRSRLWRLNTELGLLLLEVDAQNYGSARARSTAWFNELTTAERATSNAAEAQTLSELSQRRDAITALLTEGNPDARGQIREMYRMLAETLEN